MRHNLLFWFQHCQTRWHIGERRAQSKTFSLVAEAVLTDKVLLSRATQPDCTEQGWQHTILSNTKDKNTKKQDKTAWRTSLFETYDITSCHLQKCLKQGSKQRQWACSALQKAIQAHISVSEAKWRRQACHIEPISIDRCREPEQRVDFAGNRLSLTALKLQSLCLHVHYITRLQRIIRLSSQDVLTILNVTWIVFIVAKSYTNPIPSEEKTVFYKHVWT